jgi:hypothetical protein
VLVDGSGAAWLVDFDDCLDVGESVATVSGFKRHLFASPGADRANTFASRLAGGLLPEVECALAAAFSPELAREEVPA